MSEPERYNEENLLDQLRANSPEIYSLIEAVYDPDLEFESTEDGQIVCDGSLYQDTPRMRNLGRIAHAIRQQLPPVDSGSVRLWRGNRVGEVGLNPSYTNSLEGIALPFLLGYGGPLSYVDVREDELDNYLSSGAEGAEFILPSEIVSGAHVVGLSDAEADALKKESRPEDDWERDKWPSIGI